MTNTLTLLRTIMVTVLGFFGCRTVTEVLYLRWQDVEGITLRETKYWLFHVTNYESNVFRQTSDDWPSEHFRDEQNWYYTREELKDSHEYCNELGRHYTNYESIRKLKLKLRCYDVDA